MRLGHQMMPSSKATRADCNMPRDDIRDQHCLARRMVTAVRLERESTTNGAKADLFLILDLRAGMHRAEAAPAALTRPWATGLFTVDLGGTYQW